MQSKYLRINNDKQKSGLFFALGSVVLVSVAQLSLKYAMQQWPVALSSLASVTLLIKHLAPLTWLMTGVICYGLSVLCWLVALGNLPLSVAYPLLSLSYLLVQIGAIVFFNERFSLQSTMGLALIMLGVCLLAPTAKVNPETS